MRVHAPSHNFSFSFQLNMTGTERSGAKPLTSHFDRLGGEAGVARLVDAFYQAMDSMESAKTIRDMHEPDITSAKSVLARYLSHWLGAPAFSVMTPGTPVLQRRHLHYRIDADARDAWMACMRIALAQACEDEGLRFELEGAFLELTHHMSNTIDASAH